jgi:hypothetical protein
MRFRPTEIQVHHIQHQADDGTHDPDNLFPGCLTCHNAIHLMDGPKVSICRKIQPGELRGRRDRLYDMIARGILPREEPGYVETVTAPRASPAPPQEVTEIVLTAARGSGDDQGEVMLVQDTEGWSLQAGGRTMFQHGKDRRRCAAYLAALESLAGGGMLRCTFSDGGTSLYTLTNEGYALAERITAASRPPA